MKELSFSQVQHVSGAGLITGEQVETTLHNIYDGAVIGATSYALSAGKWGGLSILNFGIGQAVGVALGLIIGGVGGAFYGLTHTSSQSESFFNNILKNVG